MHSWFSGAAASGRTFRSASCASLGPTWLLLENRLKGCQPQDREKSCWRCAGIWERERELELRVPGWLKQFWFRLCKSYWGHAVQSSRYGRLTISTTAILLMANLPRAFYRHSVKLFNAELRCWGDDPTEVWRPVTPVSAQLLSDNSPMRACSLINKVRACLMTVKAKLEIALLGLILWNKLIPVISLTSQ